MELLWSYSRTHAAFSSRKVTQFSNFNLGTCTCMRRPDRCSRGALLHGGAGLRVRRTGARVIASRAAAPRTRSSSMGPAVSSATAAMYTYAAALLLISSACTPRTMAAEVVGFRAQLGPRLSIEQTHTLKLQPSAGEPNFHAASGDAVCVIIGAGDGFAIGLPTHQAINSSDPEAGPPLRKNLMEGLLIVPASVTGPRVATCEVPKFGTVGNTSVCVVLGPVSPYDTAPPKLTCNAGPDNSTYAPAFFHRLALFSPQFGRRPFIREQNGSVILMTDSSLAGQRLHFQATIAGLEISHQFVGGTNVSFTFPLTEMPASVVEDVVLSLTLGDGKTVVSHTRTFVRVPPPAVGSGLVAWQVDHTSKGLLVDGVPFIATGWFGSGGLHESAGLPVAAVVAAARENANDNIKTMTLSELDALAAASTVTEWGRQGHTFVKAGFQPRMAANGETDDGWANESVRLSLEYMDAAAAAGVYVLVDMSEDGLALAMSGQDKKKVRWIDLTPRHSSSSLVAHDSTLTRSFAIVHSRQVKSGT
jgi:hypothetical protein